MNKHIFKNVIVRANVPVWIREEGREPVLRSLDKTEYWNALVDKLIEESLELKQDPSLDELVDVCEVIEALRRELNLSEPEVQVARERARWEKGEFTPHNFIEEVLESKTSASSAD